MAAGALLGTSTITSYVESAAVVAAGGRTGLANMVTAALFLLALFFFPLIRMIGEGYVTSTGQHLYPVVAPALILIGSFMLRAVKQVTWAVLKLVTGRLQDAHWLIHLFAALLGLRYVVA